MKSPLRVLHLEDNRSYSELVQARLQAEGFQAEVVCIETKEEFESALARETFDLIIADYRLPAYDGISALKFARQNTPDIPTLLVSGAMGEEAAIEGFKAGATDYVLKHWPERLIPAVRRALSVAGERANRLRAEAALAQREKYFRALSENAIDIVTIINQQAVFIYNSPSIQRVAGYAPQELIGTSVFNLVHPDDHARVREDLEHCLQHPETTTVSEFRVRHKNGSWRYLESIGRNLLNEPEISGVVVNCRDVTDRRRVEHYNEVLSRLGLKLSSATGSEGAAKIIVEVADDLFGWDACTLNLYSPDEDKIYPVLTIDTIRGEKLEISGTEIDKHPTTRTRRIINNGPELILRQEPITIGNDGITIGDKARPSASLMFVPIRNRTRVIGILSIQSYRLKAYDEKDLAALQTLADYCGGALERIRIEQALRESERRFRHLFENSPDAIFVEDVNGTVLDANVAAGWLHAMPYRQLIGKNVAELVPPEEHEKFRQNFQKLAAGEIRQVLGLSSTSDGRVIPVEVRTSQIDYSGKPALLLHVRDISERKEAEEALKGSEIRFHSVWENSVDGMRLTDENGIIIAVNEAFCKLVGMNRQELEGKPFTVTYAVGENLEQKLAFYRQRFQERTVARRIERKLTFRSGKTVNLEGANSYVEVHGQKPLLLGLFRDITEQKRLEDQLRHSQKMDAIGQLAGGVAHDFNNILTVIQGHASLLRSSGKLEDFMITSAEQIVQAADRAAGLTRQLLTFSRRQMMQPKLLDLNVVVSNMTKMLGRILGEDIALQFNYAPNLPLVHADSGMMEQVLLNLAVNSRDAMRGGGQLTVKIFGMEITGLEMNEHPEGRTGHFVCLKVSDTGCGIEPKNLPHIFEPFFTTKAIGKGTGLGLATVYGIVKQHQGWIEVTSSPGVGTTFQVFLLASNESSSKLNGTTPLEEAVRGGTETILVVEDEAAVRELVCKILISRGYQVLHAVSGSKALEVWKEHKNRIDLLLTDMVMPDGMSGRDLAEQIQTEKPGLKAVFTSGYSSEIAGKDFILKEGLNFLQKPYHPHKLVRVIRKCLDDNN
ncbi:PAS domain S-box protein [Pedosphaera parvula]|uniref:histidine kinase n=1 Tax=Pedosphaera parvula (strain Ellin514) TaxID=320771 RepID=B9XC97_PEDPL|nr:PAS domain S-box protein [Pedosphaera parvula]EEF62565.1 multi-sensor hybrid histidine kinase [Pedosphaera parvula Ellin514]